ncbi:MAG: HAMP domain-containing sensor histidine kinase [Candidatus Spechtbacterales bacterium]
MEDNIKYSAKTTEFLQELLKGMQEVSSGNLDYELEAEAEGELKNLAEQFNDMVKCLKDNFSKEKNASDTKSKFLSVAAHQLRTPLSAMKWTFNMLLDGDLGELKEEQIEVIKQSNEMNERMIATINDLLNVSRMESGRLEYRFQEVDLVQIIKEVFREEEVRARKRNINLIFEELADNLPPLNADPEKLLMVVSNLIDNAIKYTPDGQTVKVKLEKRDDYIQFSVQDEGIGIPKELFPKLFTRFSRGENAMRLHTTGTGLGLFIAKNIIERHGGKIWAESEEGKGSVFFFTLPLDAGDRPEEAEHAMFE